MSEKSKPAKRWAVRATNDLTGEIWSIHDTRAVCESQLELKLADWGQPDARVEWAEVVDGIDQAAAVRGVVEPSPETDPKE
jgi:hypothetical protein